MNTTRVFFIFVSFQLGWFSRVLAQSDGLVLENVCAQFQALSGVSHILQDRYGFLWFGTGSGLLKFDGSRVETFRHDPADSFSLSNSSVTALAAGTGGCLWIGTIEGLNHLNPANGKVIRYRHDAENPASLSDNYVTAILQNRAGTLWIGTQQAGLNEALPVRALNRERLNFMRHLARPEDTTSLSSNYVRFVFEDTLNTAKLLWIGTANGLNAFDRLSRKFIRYFHDPKNPNGLPENDLYSIFQDKSGALWIGMEEGWLSQVTIGRRGKIKFKNYQIGAHLKIYCIRGDAAGDLWLSTYYNGLYRFNRKTFKITHYDEKNLKLKNVTRFAVSTTFIDDTGTLWIGTWPFLYKLDPHRKQFRFVALDPPPKIWAMSVSDFYLDTRGTLWLGTHGRGILKYDLQKGQVRAFAPDSASQRFLSSRWVQAILADPTGAVWVATFHGLNRYDSKRDRFEQIFWNPDQPDNAQNLISNYIYCLATDHRGNLWIGSARGLSRLNPATGESRHYLNDSENQISLAGHYVGAVLEDREGKFWVGARGLFQLDPVSGKLTPFYYLENQRWQWIEEIVFSIYEDRAGNLWIGTYSGLYRFDTRQKMTHFTAQNALPGDCVYGILEDQAGCLWVSTPKGLAKFDLRSDAFRLYDLKVGWHRNEFGKGYVDPAGRCYLAQANGFTLFNPDEIKDNPVVPRVWITGMTLFDQPLLFDKSFSEQELVRLSYRQNMFSFKFIGLNFTESSDNQYAYKLEGFNADWIYCGHQRSATFANLAPGKYVFRVKASNNDGIWNETGAAIRLIILPPWYRSRWAYGAYLIFGLVILGGLAQLTLLRQRKLAATRLRTEQERHRVETAEHRAVLAELQARTAEAEKEIEKEQMRSRIAGDLHDEIGSNLSTIAIISQLAAEKLKLRKSDKLRLLEIPRIARETAESMREIVWFIHPENDTMERLLIKMRQTANLMLEHVDFSFALPPDGISFEASIDFRRNVYLIFKEILQNIIKHAGATQVEIELREQNGFFELQVTDNGIGIDTGREDSGTGMKNFQRRTQALGGTIEILSEKNRGTRILFRVKIP